MRKEIDTFLRTAKPPAIGQPRLTPESRTRKKPMIKIALILLGLVVYLGMQPADPVTLRAAQERLRQSEMNLAAAKERLRNSVHCLTFGRDCR